MAALSEFFAASSSRPSSAAPAKPPARSSGATHPNCCACLMAASPSSRNQFVDFLLAVGEVVEMNARSLQKGEVQVGQRRRLGVFDMARALRFAGAASCYHDRQVHVVVNVRIA